MKKHTILFLAANPSGTDRLALDREARGIQKELEQSGYRDCFEFVTRWAAEPLDLLRELRKLKPTVVHFSGHGGPGAAGAQGPPRRDLVGELGPDGGEPPRGLFFQGPDGRAQLVSTAALEEAFGAAGTSVKLVVLNACYTEAQAEALLVHADCVVGVGGSIHDNAARSFAIGFYGGLGERESVAAAYKQGCAAVSLEGLRDSDRPQLKVRAGVDASQFVLAADSPVSPDAAPPPHEPLSPSEGSASAADVVSLVVKGGRTPLRLLPAALHAIPAVKFGFAALALAACVAIGLRLFESPQFAIIGLVVGFSVMGLLVVFSHVAARREQYRRQATIFVWVCLGLFTVWAVGMTFSVFLGWPVETSMFQSSSVHRGDASIPDAITVSAPKRAYRRSYYQGFSGVLPSGATRYEDVWQIGESGDWTATITDGVYRLCNSAGDSTASYTNRLQNVVEGSTVDMTDGRVTLRVATEPPNTTYSGAGLLFRSSRDAQNYLAYVLNPGPGVSLLQKRGNQLKILWSEGIPEQPGRLTELRIEGQGDQVALYVDDRLVHTATVSPERGDVGIMAYSTGCFVLDDITMYAPVTERRNP